MKRILVLAGFIVLVSGVSRADFAKGSQTLSLQLGGSFSDDSLDTGKPGGEDDERFSDSGSALGGQYVYYVSPHVGIGLDVNHSQSKERSYSLDDNYDAESYARPTTFMPIVRVSRSRGALRPFVFGGVGMHNTKVRLALTPKAVWLYPPFNQEQRTFVDGSGTGVAATLGGGLDLFITEALFIGAELRGTFLGKANYGHTQDAENVDWGDAEGSMTVGNALFRVGFKFGA